MKYERFEDTPVWQAAADLEYRISRLVEHSYFRSRRDLADQLDRAAVSVSNNIAEGFERGSTAELIAFLYYSRGSAGEVRSMLHGRLRRASDVESSISDLKSEILNLIRLAESISRQLRGWADHLQNSEIRGQRHLTDAERARFDRVRRADAFLQKIRELAPPPRDPE